MTFLSQEMCANAGLPENSTVHDLISKLEEGGSNVLDGLLSNEVGRSSALQSLSQLSQYRLEVISQVGRYQQKFFKLIVDGQSLPVLVGLIGADDVANPVTELENLIFWATIDTRTSVHNDWCERDGLRFINWRSAMRKKALIALPVSLESSSFRRFIAALFSLEHSDLPLSTVGETVLTSAVGATLRGAADYSPTQARLVFEAISESNPKWRCLSFYRILENAYLNNIKNILNSQFDFDAKAALITATKSVSSELQQLVALTETLELQSEFESFNVAIESLLTTGNGFIGALDKSAREDKDLYGSKDLWRKAVLRFYKLRCSIAHGGTSSVIYEQFVDANIAALGLLPSIEEIAFKSLKIEMRA